MPFINWARSAGGGLVDKDLPAPIGDCALTVTTSSKATTVSGGASLELDIAVEIMARGTTASETDFGCGNARSAPLRGTEAAVEHWDISLSQSERSRPQKTMVGSTCIQVDRKTYGISTTYTCVAPVRSLAKATLVSSVDQEGCGWRPLGPVDCVGGILHPAQTVAGVREILGNGVTRLPPLRPLVARFAQAELPPRAGSDVDDLQSFIGMVGIAQHALARGGRAQCARRCIRRWFESRASSSPCGTRRAARP